MRNVGIFKNFMDEERSTIGIFGEDFITAIKMINTKKFTPRKNILNKNLTIDHMLVLWRELLEKVFQELTIVQVHPGSAIKKQNTKPTLLFCTEVITPPLLELKRYM